MVFSELDKHKFTVELTGLEALAMQRLISDYVVDNDPINERAKNLIKYFGPSVLPQIEKVKELDETPDQSNIIEYNYARRRYYERPDRSPNVTCFYGG